MNKKAALELSINAIVILILAITMLGLGLGFMRNIFGSATEQFTQVTGAVEKQMVEQMKETNKIVDISRPKLTIKKGDSEQVFIGLKNVKSAANHYLIVNPKVGSHMEKVGTNDPCIKLDIGYKNDPTQVSSGDVVVLPMNIKAAPDAPEGTCFIDVEVCIDETLTHLLATPASGNTYKDILACRQSTAATIYTAGGATTPIQGVSLDDAQHLQLVVDVTV